MRKLTKDMYVVLAIAAIGSVLSLLLSSTMLSNVQIFSSFGFLAMFILLVLAYLELALFGYALLGLVILTSLDSFSIFTILFIFIIGNNVWTYWIKDKKITQYASFQVMSYQQSKSFANIFMILLVINIAFILLSTGSASVITSPIYLISMFTSTVQIFALYLASIRRFEAAYFYITYLILSLVVFLITNTFASLVSPSTIFLVIGIYLCGITIVALFIKRNK